MKSSEDYAEPQGPAERKASVSPALARINRGRRLLPGLSVVVTISLAASFIADRHGGQPFLIALLLGMALNFLWANPQIRGGVDFAARAVLRFGVALLGVRITVEHIADLGLATMALAACSVVVAISSGLLLAHIAGRSRQEALLSGGAVGICGASAAMAIAAVLPRSPANERLTLLTVLAVTSLSTVAMVVYPLIATLLGFDDRTSGVLFGATIHDVAQVVGAGLSVSPETADSATFVKLVRVACLLPLVLLIASVQGARNASGGNPLSRFFPPFLIGFALLVALGSLVSLPAGVVQAGSSISHACLLVAISALGVKTSLRDLLALGWRPLTLILGETAILFCFVAAVLVFVWQA